MIMITERWKWSEEIDRALCGHFLLDSSSTVAPPQLISFYHHRHHDYHLITSASSRLSCSVIISSISLYDSAIPPVHKALWLDIGDNVASSPLVLNKIVTFIFCLKISLNDLVFWWQSGHDDTVYLEDFALIWYQPGWTFLWWAHPTPSQTLSPAGTSWGLIIIIKLKFIKKNGIWSIHMGWFFHWYHPKKLKYVKSRLGESM